MRDLREFIGSLETDKPSGTIITFFVDNAWFGETLCRKNGAVLLTEEQEKLFRSKLELFLQGSPDEMYVRFGRAFPKTDMRLRDFISKTGTEDTVRYYLTDFLLYRLEKELFLYTDPEISSLLTHASFDLTKAHGDMLTFFLAYMRSKTRTAYFKDYTLGRRYTMDSQNGAYCFDEYIQLVYYLFAEEYIQDNDMFEKAACSKNYTDTWLYLALHVIRPLRLPDLERIYHPVLPYPAEEVLERIKNGTFTDNDARKVLLSITKRMSWLPLTPNKTEGTGGVTPILFDIPVNCESMMGKLFALAQAHRDIAGTPDAPVVRKISTYQEISRYMGEEIGELFLYNDFRSRSATKSFLQDICMVTDESSCDESGFRVKGYILAAIARSHKGSYGRFAATTFEYLKDAKLGGMNPEMVAFELLQRGVFSFMSSMLLKMMFGRQFEDLTPSEQTSVIQAVDLSPKEIEAVVSTVSLGRDAARNTLQAVITDETDILTVLHRIGSGGAVSKQHDCLCLMTALGRKCPEKGLRSCVACRYEISTRSTLFLLIREYNRTKNLYLAVTEPMEKAKYKTIIQTVIAPKLDEMLMVIKEEYGDELFREYESLIKENT
ncbi:MAG: hypothetical protein MJ117_00465 [Lachnospiraceae bacterium]|nr:hypothetical protein [Lachnospiraceae bacterium]